MDNLIALAKLIRYYIIYMTTQAGSGHATSSLSAVELMTVLYFSGVLRQDLSQPDFPNNDRVVFSKGHASPLFYALYAAAGRLSFDELKTYRQFGSPLEGHPTPRFPFTEAATGSLGQGLSVGVGLALNAKYLDQLNYRTYVLLGDSELSEGQIWEAMQLAVHYKLDNLIAVADVNRLGQRGPTMYGYNLETYQKKAEAFGWEALLVDGHNLTEIQAAFKKALTIEERPTLILAKTVKGKGISFLEDQEDWHGKSLKQAQFLEAIKELGEIDKSLTGEIKRPDAYSPPEYKPQQQQLTEKFKKSLIHPQSNQLATRHAYGNALAKLGAENLEVVSLDAEVSNSTYAEVFKQIFPERFFEMYIAEQNMVSTAVGLAQTGKIPFVSSFAAFLTRTFDQIRMAQYSQANLKLVGSHAGVSIGHDGPSQMGLEDLAMFRSIKDSVVLYPSDAVSTEKLVFALAEHYGLAYLRTTRMKTPIIYHENDQFELGGSQSFGYSDHDLVTLVAAGVTLHQALKAQEYLAQRGISVRVIDLYSVKPLDETTLKKAAQETQAIVTIEDHYPAGGIGEAVKTFLVNQSTPVYSLAVDITPSSGSPQELLKAAGLDAASIVEKVESIL